MTIILHTAQYRNYYTHLIDNLYMNFLFPRWKPFNEPLSLPWNPSLWPNPSLSLFSLHPYLFSLFLTNQKLATTISSSPLHTPPKQTPLSPSFLSFLSTMATPSLHPLHPKLLWFLHTTYRPSNKTHIASKPPRCHQRTTFPILQMD